VDLVIIQLLLDERVMGLRGFSGLSMVIQLWFDERIMKV